MKPDTERFGPLGGLEIEESLPVQLRIWRFERIGWATLTVFVGAGLLGLFGDGPLSQAELTGSSRALVMRYERFIHNDTQTELEILATAAESDGWHWISLSADYVRRVRIERIMPEPERTVVTNQVVRFGFDPANVGQDQLVTISLAPRRMGVLRSQIGVAEDPSVAFTQIVFP